MERVRFQGITNIIRFNWHYYLLSILVAGGLFFAGWYLFGGRFRVVATISSMSVVGVSGFSLLVSFYIYDLSGLYTLAWLEDAPVGLIVNIHAGFDETSHLLARKFPSSELKVFDFYDPIKHTEISIARARRSYPPYPGTVGVSTAVLPLEDSSVDTVYVIFSAHEIRERQERAVFFKELNRILKHSGRIVVTEHLRDRANFIAYTIGAFHFLPASAWAETFGLAGLQVCGKKKVTPFITTFTLWKNGTAY